jgi:hypothetical protein
MMIAAGDALFQRRSSAWIGEISALPTAVGHLASEARSHEFVL